MNKLIALLLVFALVFHCVPVAAAEKQNLPLHLPLQMLHHPLRRKVKSQPLRISARWKWNKNCLVLKSPFLSIS